MTLTPRNSAPSIENASKRHSQTLDVPNFAELLLVIIVSLLMFLLIDRSLFEELHIFCSNVEL